MRRTRADRGAAAVEFALVLPVLLLLLFGIIDFGRMVHAKVTLTEAAREGARTAALRNSASEARDTARQITDGIGTVSFPTLTTCANQSTVDAVVEITHQFRFVTPIGFLIGSGSTTTLRSEGLMPCLH
jgi:Flp pilus assembly protein TadG